MGGVGDAIGTPCCDDYSGSGAWLARELSRVYERVSSRELVRLWCEVLGFEMSAWLRRELMTAVMAGSAMARVDPQGDWQKSEFWRGGIPGVTGISNATSAKYNRGELPLEFEVPVLWVRGGRDLIGSDFSPFDPQALGM